MKSYLTALLIKKKICFDSFDVVRDTLGLVRTEFPHTVYFVAGTQVSFVF